MAKKAQNFEKQIFKKKCETQNKHSNKYVIQKVIVLSLFFLSTKIKTFNKI